MSAPARRVVAALAGAGLVAVSAPAVAAPRADDESAALVLLVDAAQASRSLTYRGTQYVASWGAAAGTALVEVQHAPGRGVRVAPTADGGQVEPVVVTSGALDERLLDVLRDRYALRLAGEGTCAGRTAHVVEARRPDGGAAEGTVAARFWVDQDTGLLLRRELFDADGRRVRSSAFLDLSVAPAPPAPRVGIRAVAVRDDPGEPVPSDRLRVLREAGQLVPDRLPGGFTLFEARSRVHPGKGEVLHLAYSDGLSTTSLFSQPGELGSAPPERFTARRVGGEPVWAAAGAPQRLVWSGGGRVWTLVSDAPDDAVDAAVSALPHDAMPDDARSGWRARLARGAARLVAALNPFS